MATQDASFTSLPIELIEHIFANLWDPLDFCNASSTCKQLRAASERLRNEHLVLALRYSALNFPGEDVSADAWTVLDDMLKNPRIAYHVHEIDFGVDRERFYDTSVGGPWDINPTTTRPPRDLLDRLLTANGIDAILRDDTDTPPLWGSLRNPLLDLDDGFDDPINSTILRQLPNLHEMRFVDSGENVNLGRFLRDTVTWPKQNIKTSFLSKLKVVTLEHWDTEGGMPLNFVLNFMHFPSVRTIRGHMMVEADEGWQPPLAISNPVLPKSNITTLDFTYSTIELDSLDELLSHTQNLKYFSYAHAGAIVGYAEYDPRGMIASLLKHAGHSLEVMKLENDDDQDVNIVKFLSTKQRFNSHHSFVLSAFSANDFQVDETSPYCSMSGFKSLKIVDVEWLTLIANEEDTVNEAEKDEPLSQGFFNQDDADQFEPDVAAALPATIQHLKLTKFPEQEVSFISKLLNDKEHHGAVPQLNNITLCGSWEQPPSGWDVLYEAAKTAGVVVDDKAESTEDGIGLLQDEWDT
jgi:hypothetical protein